MKNFYLLFSAMILAACSAEPVENEVLSGLDADLSGKKIKATEALDPMGFYAGNSGNLKGTLAVWNDCDNLYLEITPTKDAPEEVEISFVTTLPVLNNGGNFKQLPVDYSLGTSEDLVWTIPVSEFILEEDLFIFVKAWGDYSGTSTFGERAHQYTDYSFDFSMCEDCEESFNYHPTEDGRYTFTYVPAEDILNAQMVFTFPQATAVSGLEGWSNNGNGNSQTWKRTEDLIACQTYTWTVELKADCPGNSNNNNLWTDFKVDDISKKGDLPNIQQKCN